MAWKDILNGILEWKKVFIVTLLPIILLPVPIIGETSVSVLLFLQIIFVVTEMVSVEL